MGIFSRKQEDDFDGFVSLQKLLERELHQKMLLFVFVFVSFLLLLFAHIYLISRPELTRLVSVILMILMLFLIWFFSHIYKNRDTKSNKLQQILTQQPRRIIWIYTVNYDIAPAGIYLYRRSTLVFNLQNREQLFLFGSPREVENAKRVLAKILPHATFGYTKEREQWFMASPLLLWNENVPLPDDDDDDDDDGHIEEKEEIESVGAEDAMEEVPDRIVRKPRKQYRIQEVIKRRQILLVQVEKEERGNKGAALTTYLSLAGRYSVLMPNTGKGGGISRKITNAADRKKLKEIASEMEVPEGAGLIIRTAGSQRTRTEIRRDYEYLMRLWEQIRELTFKSVAPAPVYEEGDLIKRTIRDIYSKEIDEVLVEGERGYRTAKDFMKMIMPSHAKNVKHYTEQMPLYARFQVESYLSGMFNPTVQLKSGGYIVIGVTEALVAIDVNSGRATKEGSIEDTALKTNLEAADEVARQLRLRDLAGLIVIDFIDMEERKNNAAVEKRFKDKLKTDRARIQVGRISGFGLMEMSRQRLRPGMLESTTQPCPHCHGTGLIRSDDSLALTILRAIEEEGTRKRSREVLVKAPIAVANFLMNAKREHIAGIEARYGMSVRVEADPTLISPDFAIEKFKTAIRNVPEVLSPVVSVDARLMAQIDENAAEEEIEDEVEDVTEAEDSAEDTRAESEAGDEGENGGKSRRRRRRRRRGGKNGENGEAEGENGDEAQAGEDAATAEVDADSAEAAPSEAAPAAAEDDAKPRRRTRSRRRKSDEVAADEPVAEAVAEAAVESAADEAVVATAEVVDLSALPMAEPAQIVAEAPAFEAVSADPAADPAPAVAPEAPLAEIRPEPTPAPETLVHEPVAPAPEPELAEAEDLRPKRRGWWSLG